MLVTFSATFYWSVNCKSIWVFKFCKHITDMSRRLSIFFIREIWCITTTKYFFSHFLVWSANYTYFIRHLSFMSSVDLWGYLAVHFWKCQFQLLVTFSAIFYWPVNSKSRVYIFRTWAMLIWEDFVLIFIKSENLFSICLF